MRIQKTQGVLVEVFADNGKVLDLGNGEYQPYACVPESFDTSTIKEVLDENVDGNIIFLNAQNKKIADIDKYDTSTNVNGFYVNGIHLWIPRETRVSLQNSTEILLKNNIETATLWDGTTKFVLPCKILLLILDEIEIYALKCFNMTAEHKANVLNMTSLEDVENYDYTIGYPEKLSFNLG